MDFIVMGAPRSGTCWAANWLNSEHALCLHDPLWRLDLDQLDRFQTRKRYFGIACTGVALFPKHLAGHPARRVVLHRPIKEINRSLKRMGLDPVAPEFSDILQGVEGLHVHWLEVFTQPHRIWEHLLPDVPFDEERHKELRNYNVQMDFERIDPDPDVVRRMLARLKSP
jgi:hypothetical protein